MKNWRWVAVGVAVPGLLIALLLTTRDDDDTGPGFSAPRPAVSTAPAAAAPSPSSADGELRIVEQGFTDRADGRYRHVYAAYTLQNTSTREIAFDTDLKVTYYDARNRPIRTGIDLNSTYSGPVMPGSTATYAATFGGHDVPVRRMSVELTGAKWVPATDRFYGLGPLTTRDVKVLPAAVPGVTTVTCTVTNGLERSVMAAALLIYRDKAGRLLGAQKYDIINRAELHLPPGDSTASTTFRTYFPPGTDMSRLQITMRPGFLAPDL